MPFDNNTAVQSGERRTSIPAESDSSPGWIRTGRTALGNEPPQASHDREDPNRWGTPGARTVRNGSTENEDQARDQDFSGGDDRTRTDDPLLAKQISIAA